MSRCGHGFETTVVPCPEGCVSTEPAAKQPRRVVEGNRPRKFGDTGGHPGFVDMTGQVRAGATIIGRAANVNGNARWHCTLACGCAAILEGIAIREAERRGGLLRCRDHRERRSGTVQRRARG